MNEQDIKDAVGRELTALRSHHVTVNYLMVGLVALVLFFGGWLVAHNVASYESRLAKADAQYAELQKDLKQMQADFLQHEKERDANDKQVQVIDHVIKVTNDKADEKIADVLDVTKTQVDVSKDANTYLGVTPVIEVDNLLAFPLPSVQGFIATKIDDERQKEMVDNQRQELALERSSKDSLGKDLKQCQTSLTEAQASIAAYSKLARKGKWRKVGDTLLKVGIGVGGLLIGHSL